MQVHKYAHCYELLLSLTEKDIRMMMMMMLLRVADGLIIVVVVCNCLFVASFKRRLIELSPLLLAHPIVDISYAYEYVRTYVCIFKAHSYGLAPFAGHMYLRTYEYV